ncbi:hypothetical protein RUND412_000087 [Rhizina undulata]
MIATAERPDGFKGFLIDLDMAVSTDLVGDRKVGHHRTGTLAFMSLNVLKRGQHTFRDDLESFLYVLLYICFKWNGPNQPNKELTPIDCWSRPDFDDVYAMKVAFMFNRSDFEGGLKKMTTEMQSLIPLLEDLRSKIRPWGTEFELGPPETDPGKLYREVISAFDRAITNERQRNADAMKTRSGMAYKR